jgi:hypothetical protein
MTVTEIRCGSSSAVFSVVPSAGSVPEDREVVRLRTRLHTVARKPGQAGFRVVGVSATGREALICLAHSRAEAAVRLRTAGYAVVRLPRWAGTAFAGRWETLAVRTRRGPRRVRRGGPSVGI